MTYQELNERYEALIARKNTVDESHHNGIYERWVNPVLTREHVPPFWVYDPNPETNPYLLQRLGINAAFNSGAILLNGKYTLVARIEGSDRKSFFAVAQSDSPTEGFRFWDEPILLPDTCPEETNVYDMRLTQHEDGWIYGVFCSESKDRNGQQVFPFLQKRIDFRLERQKAAFMLAYQPAIKINLSDMGHRRHTQHETLVPQKRGYGEAALVKRPAVMLLMCFAFLQVVIGSGYGHGGGIRQRPLKPFFRKSVSVIQLKFPHAA